MTAWLDHLSARGWAVLPEVYPEADCAQLRAAVDRVWRTLGAPVPYDPGEVFLDGEGTSLSSAGFVCRQLLDLAPEVAEILDRPALLDVIDTVLGPGALIEGVAGNLNDATRPFCYWHNHVGGIHAGHFRELGRYPAPDGPIRRLVCVIYVDGLSPENGEMLVWPRGRTDPAAPPREDFGSTSWPGEDVVQCPDGSLLLLDEYTWHAVRRQQREGNRHYVGLYAVARGGVTTSFAVPALRVPAGRSARFLAMLEGAPGAEAPGAEPRAEVVRTLGETIRVEKATCSDGKLLLDVAAGEARATIEISPYAPDRPHFCRVGDLLLGYRGQSPSGPSCTQAAAEALEVLGLDFDGLSAHLGVSDGER
jgi:hypothetical protein